MSDILFTPEQNEVGCMRAHVLWTCHSSDMCKILLWSAKHILNQSTSKCHWILNLIEILLVPVGGVPDILRHTDYWYCDGRLLTRIQPGALQTWSNKHDIVYIIAVAEVKCESEFQYTKDTPLFVWIGKIWGVLCEDFGENRLHYIGATLCVVLI